jgi:tRNA (guanine26-N2/guanine27-N2)-dimethyltransferase
LDFWKCANATWLVPQADKERYAAFGKIKGLLTSASEELHDAPLYYNLHAVCKTLHVTPPSGDTVRSALINAGTFPPP